MPGASEKVAQDLELSSIYHLPQSSLSEASFGAGALTAGLLTFEAAGLAGALFQWSSQLASVASVRA